VRGRDLGFKGGDFMSRLTVVSTFLIFIFLNGPLGFASEDLSIPKVPANPLPTKRDLPALDCTNLVEGFKDYNKMARNHDLSIADFVQELSSVMSNWYEAFKRWEGETVTIERGTFSPIQKGSEEIYQVVDLVYENSEFLERRLLQLIDQTEKCIVKSDIKK
jgi:hypothetical protein